MRYYIYILVLETVNSYPVIHGGDTLCGSMGSGRYIFSIVVTVILGVIFLCISNTVYIWNNIPKLPQLPGASMAIQPYCLPLPPSPGFVPDSNQGVISITRHYRSDLS